MKKHLLYTALWLLGLMGTLAIWVTKAEYSQVINITWFDVDTPNQLIQSFTQKRDDLELYFVSYTWNISHYTIMDRNMWSEEVFNWDFDSYNTWSFWYQYQWWNNYWFEPCYENNCDTFTNNSGFISTVPYEVWGAYMPSKYARNTRATGNPNVSNNDYRRKNWMVWLDNNTTWKWNNIWWWSWDSYNWNWPWTAVDRKGPCPEGYHIPSSYNFEIFSKLRKATWRSSSFFSLDLLLPLGWSYRESYNFKISGIGLAWDYLLSSPKSVYDSDFYHVRKDYWVDHASSVVNPTARGLYIRCFKNLNNDLSTNFSLHLNWWTKAVIAFTGNVWEWKITALSTPTKSNYIFLGWYDAEFDWNEVKIWSIVPNNLYARWWWCKDGYEENEGKTACLMKTYTITYNLNWWTNSTLNPWTYTVGTPTITLKNATRNWSIFDWWYSDEDFTTKVTSITKWSTWDITLYAKWWWCKDGYEENEEKTECLMKTYTITYNLHWWTNSTLNPWTYTVETPTITLKNATRNWSIFDWWYSDEDFTTKVTSITKWSTWDITLYAKWWWCKDGYEENEEKTECLMKTYTITYNLHWWTNSTLNPWTYTVETPTITLKDATRNWFIFDWRYSDEDFTTKVTSITKWNTWDIILYAKWWCEDWYIENESWTACEKIRVDFDANGWTFSDNDNIYTVIKSKQVLWKIMKTLHTANLDDNGNYTNEFNWQPMNGYTTSIAQYTSWWITTYPISSASLMYFEEENIEKLDVSIKYWWSPYCTPWYIILWTWDRRQFDANYNPWNTGLSVLYIGDFPSYWENSEKSVEIKWDGFTIYQNGWCPSYWFFANISRTWILDLIYEENAFDNIPEPTREWHSFKWWYLTDGTKFNTWNVSTWEIIKVYAKWECADEYENKWWECVKKSSWSSGWGGRSNKTSDTQDSSTSSQNNKNTENVIQSETKWSEESSNTPMDSSDKSSEWQEILSPSDSSFTKEQKDAYTFAHEKWITTMPTIQDAQMDWKLTRIAMAKMLSQYAMNVLWQKPANIVTPKFNDVTDKQNSDYDDWVSLAYQLWIMWQNMPNNKFRPDDEVTRAEFATALSRMLYHTSDWEYKSTDKYYTNHMKKLVQEKIITNDDAKMKELRWYVMIMLMRSAK